MPPLRLKVFLVTIVIFGSSAPGVGYADPQPSDPQPSPAATSSPAAQSNAPTVTLPPVVVTATRTNIAPDNSTSYLTVFTNEDVKQTPALVVDDALRQVPGFNTFRRSSSIVAAPADDPEAQGVTLRGVGPGGASRALVLFDGIPVNDAFGGWIYWDELPLSSIDRVEIVQGGGSNLWGSQAEGGVINIISKPPTPTSNVQFQGSYGNRKTTQDAVSGNYIAGPLKVTLEQDFFNTDGWNIIKSRLRGPVDHSSSSMHSLSSGRLQYDAGDGLSTFLRGSFYQEYRDLGTTFRSAAATRGFVNGGGSYVDHNGNLLNASLYAHLSTYHQNFSMVDAPRTTEIRSQSQRIPSTDVGGFLSWSRSFFEHHTLAAGGDFRLIQGTSYDAFYDPKGTAIADRRRSSGKQQFYGAYLEDLFRPTEQLEIDVSVRGDVFTDYDGKVIDRPVAGAPVTQTFTNRVRTATSPRLGVRYDPLKWLTLRMGLYEAYRAPTLAELYRQSSVEDLTLVPNPRLSPEYLQGGEVGAIFRAIPGLTVGWTGYWNILHNPINNVVTATDPITGEDSQRTRVNLGRALIRGYHIDTEYDFNWIDWNNWSKYHPRLRFTANYLRSEASLTHTSQDLLLKGRRLALVPWDTVGIGLRYGDSLLGDFWIQEQYQGKQWEDSDNQEVQASYWITNLSWSRAIPHVSNVPRLDESTAFLRIQNLFNRQYVIDRGGGIPKVGTPFTVLGGITVPLDL